MTGRHDHPLQGLYDFLLREFEAIPTSGEAVTADIRPHLNALCEYMAANETATPSSADVIEGMREARIAELKQKLREVREMRFVATRQIDKFGLRVEEEQLTAEITRLRALPDSKPTDNPRD